MEKFGEVCRSEVLGILGRGDVGFCGGFRWCRGDFWGGLAVEWRGCDAGSLGGFGGGIGRDLLGVEGSSFSGKEEEEELNSEEEEGEELRALRCSLDALSQDDKRQ